MIKKEIKIFLMSLSYFTRIPISQKINFFDESEISHILRYFPLIGLLIAISSFLVFYISHIFLGITNEIAIILSVIFSTLITGALHEDGLADSADGFGGGYGDKEKILQIMKDSRIGSYGALALIFSQLLKFYSLKTISLPSSAPSSSYSSSSLSLEHLFFALIVAHTLSRLMVFIYIFDNKNINNNNFNQQRPNSKSQSVTASANLKDFLIAIFITITALTCLGIFTKFSLIALAASITFILFIYIFIKRFVNKRLVGYGYTGDVLGAIQQIMEITIYIIISSTLIIKN
ncbi:MAG: adenosylcobinamide-GDP ribazoletransferase [Oligoflexia bacterium]|nr:adenosylcobinamide-GDP ribazoletransferase [Oligoflexia bacterium]